MMTSALDNPKTYNHFDTKDIYQSFLKLPQQIESGWHEAEFVNFGFNASDIKNICWVGMGGSNLPAKIIKALSPLLINTPFEIVSEYRLPQYVKKDTLCIIASYSGNTEEVISCLHDAKQRKSKIIVISKKGGSLGKVGDTENWPTIILGDAIDETDVPRAGIGLMLGAGLKIITRLNPPAEKYVNLEKIIAIVGKTIDANSKEINTKDNPAKTLAKKHTQQGLILFSSNHLTGTTKAISNYLNESSKTFAVSYDIPEMNHHLLDGLDFPQGLKDNFKFLIINSSLYPTIIQKRIFLTKEILTKQKFQVTVIKPESEDPVLQSFELLSFLILF